MVYRKSYRKKRYNKYRRTKRKFSSRNNRMRIGNPKQRVFYYKRFTGLDGLLAGTDGEDSLKSYTFKLSDIPGLDNFTLLYDAYKINGIQVRFLPQFTSVVSDNNNITFTSFQSQSQLRIFTAIDYNSDNTSTISDLQQYNNCKVSPYTKGQKRFLKPKIILDTGGVNAVQVFGRKNPWINTTDTDVLHYCLKVGVNTSNIDTSLIAPGNVLLAIETRYYISFKSPR